MLAEIFLSIWEKARSAAAAELEPKLLHETRTFKTLLMPNGDQLTLIRDTPRRNHQCCTLADFIETVKRFSQMKPSVWIDPKGPIVTAILADTNLSQRDDQVVFQPQYSERWKAIEALPVQSFDQRAMLQLLRITLVGAVPDYLRPAISKIEFATTAGVKS